MCVLVGVCVCLVVFFGGGGVVFRDGGGGVGGKEGVVWGRKQSKGVTAAFLLFAKKKRK